MANQRPFCYVFRAFSNNLMITCRQHWPQKRFNVEVKAVEESGRPLICKGQDKYTDLAREGCAVSIANVSLQR